MKYPIDARAQTGAPVVPGQDLGRKHGAERQCDEGRKGHGGGHGERELGEQPAHVPFEEGNGHEHRHQHHCRRDHREADLPRPTVGGHQAALAVLLHAPVHVLQHHDGVVHHQPDGQHQRKESENVDREIERPEHQEGRDQGHGYGHRRHQHGPHAAEKQKNHQNDKPDGDAEGLVDLLDRPLDEHRGVVALLDLHALGKGGVEAGHLRLGGVRHRDRVGGGLLDDPQSHHGHPVAAKEGAVLLGAALHPRHVPQANQIAALSPRDHQAGELLRGRERALHAHAELPGGRFHAARRQLHVLGPQRTLQVRHRDPAGSQGVAVDPDAHREGLVAADTHPRHPVEHREAIDQVAAGIVGELGDGHAVAHQIEPHDHILVAVHLLDIGWIRLHRELIQYPGDTVAHVIGGAVDVPIDSKLDGDGRAPVLAHGLDGLDALHPETLSSMSWVMRVSTTLAAAPG